MNCITIEMKGSITIGKGDIQLREGIKDVLDKGYDMILLDMSQVNYMDSSGLGELVASHEHIASQGKALAIYGISEKVEKLLYVSLLLDKLNCHATREEAVEALAAAST